MENEPEPSAEAPITLDEARGSLVTTSESDKDPKKDAWLASARREAVEIDGRQKYFSLRGHWSWVIIVWVTILILFNISATVAVGLKWLDFTNMQWFITAVLVETFLQIIGLGYIAVRYLFSDPKS